MPTASSPSPSVFWKQAATLWLGGFFAFFCMLPYLWALKREDLMAAVESSGMTLPVIVLLAALQNGVMMALFVSTGLAAARRLGLRAPLSEALVTRTSLRSELLRWWMPATVLGLGGGAVVIALSSAFMPFMPEGFTELGATTTWWHGLLASFYGGFTEELILRLFFLSVLALLLRFLFARSRRDLPDGIFWTANVVAAVLFGLGHLPAVPVAVEITGTLVAYVILLNGILGVLFGWLFRKHGLEAAMLAHFAADIVLHVIPPLLG